MTHSTMVDTNFRDYSLLLEWKLCVSKVRYACCFNRIIVIFSGRNIFIERDFWQCYFVACSLYLPRIKFMSVALFIYEYFDLSSFARFVAEEKRIEQKKIENCALVSYFIYLSLCVDNKMLCSLTTKMDNKKRLFAIVSLDLLQFVFMPNLFVWFSFRIASI